MAGLSMVADYIAPDDPERQFPFRVLLEIHSPGDRNEHHDDQPSPVCAVEVDNLDPRTFQIMAPVGYPKADPGNTDTRWDPHFIDETITSAFDLVDSALLHIERDPPAEP